MSMHDSTLRVYIVTVSTHYQLDGVVDDLTSHGLEVKQVLAALSQVIGEGSEQVADSLRSLAAVESVDPQQQYRTLDQRGS